MYVRKGNEQRRGFGEMTFSLSSLSFNTAFDSIWFYAKSGIPLRTFCDQENVKLELLEAKSKKLLLV